MIKVANLEEIPQGGSKLVMVEGIPVALFNIGGKILAWDNRCPHRGSSLADGNISDSIIQCKHHLWKFDVKTASAVENPHIKIKSFPVILMEGAVYLDP